MKLSNSYLKSKNNEINTMLLHLKTGHLLADQDITMHLKAVKTTTALGTCNYKRQMTKVNSNHRSQKILSSQTCTKTCQTFEII